VLNFQSAPGVEAGGNGWSWDFESWSHAFQSAPGVEAGGNKRRVMTRPQVRPFQSAPGVEAGGNGDGRGEVQGPGVSIRPRR
jgi:hypothetical protein